MSYCTVCDVTDKKPAGRCPACGRNWGPSILDGFYQGPFDDPGKGDTPRTDKEAWRFRRMTVGGTEAALDLARSFERELAERTEELDAIYKRYKAAVTHTSQPQSQAKDDAGSHVSHTDDKQRAWDQIVTSAKDAARYRYMRSSAAFQDRNGPGLYWYLPRLNRDMPLGERLDAAIDEAMGSTPTD